MKELDKAFDRGEIYQAKEIGKSLEWGMKPILDLMDLVTAKAILTEQISSEMESDNKEVLTSEIESISSIRFSNLDINTGEVLLLFGKDPSKKLSLKYNLRNEAVLRGNKKKTMDQESQKFFLEQLKGFVDVACSYEKAFPTGKESLFDASTYTFPIDDYSKIVFHPFYPSMITYPRSEALFPEWRLRDIDIPGILLPPYFASLLDTDYLTRRSNKEFIKQYQAKTRYYLHHELEK